MEGGQKGTSQETIQVWPIGMTGHLHGSRRTYMCFFPSSRKARQWPEAGNHPVSCLRGFVWSSLGGCHLLLAALFSALREETPRGQVEGPLVESVVGGGKGWRQRDQALCLELSHL